MRIPGSGLEEMPSAGARISGTESPAGATENSAECRPDRLGDAILAKALTTFLRRDNCIHRKVATDRQKSQNILSKSAHCRPEQFA
jgi:hypothetical protein